MHPNFKFYSGVMLLLLTCLLLVTSCGSLTSKALPTPSSTSTSTRLDVVETDPLVSKGCGKASLVAPGKSLSQIILSGGYTRSYLLHIPTGYKDSVQQPLVLNFHGHGSNSLQQAYVTSFSTLADQQDFIVAYPQGVVGPDRRTGWATGPAWNPQVNDVLFVSDLLNYLQSTLCINPMRIYATGFSNGGGMTNLLACKLADRIAAFAPVSGAYPAVPGGCDPARPVPLMEFHGTADHVVPYNGNVFKRYPPIDQWLQEWVARDGCTVNPTVSHPSANIIEEKWTGCRGNTVLIHYMLIGWPHAWPRTTPFTGSSFGHGTHTQHGPAPVSSSINATPIIWSFFVAHPLPPDNDVL